MKTILKMLLILVVIYFTTGSLISNYDAREWPINLLEGVGGIAFMCCVIIVIWDYVTRSYRKEQENDGTNSH